MEDMIRENAELVVAQMRPLCGFEFGYDAQSVAWLDGFIERYRTQPDVAPESVERLVSVFGSYLGECVVRCYGGRWEQEDGGWRVSFDGRNAAYPFAKVHKQFEHGAEDSILSFFEVIPLIFPAVGGGEDKEKKKPWWRFR